MELIKGLGILDASFLIPIIVIVVLIFIVAKVAKNLLKIALLIAVIALAAIVYLNLPSLKVDGGTATLELRGEKHSISIKDTKIVSEQKDGEKQTVLISGTERIVLPFSKSFADKFILEKLKESK
ncbi:MAG TPA: hypothetical protein VIK78_11955 [Ruminiclostridium sp.]